MTEEKNDLFRTDIGLLSPWMNTAGFLGYLPPASLEFSEPMGAFLPPPLTNLPRSPVANRAAISYPGGLLLHTAMPNLGVKAALKQYGQRWTKLRLPVILHFFPVDEVEAGEMSQLADAMDNVIAIEVETPMRISQHDRLSILTAAIGEKPVLAVNSMDEVSWEFLTECKERSISAAVLTAPRGRLMRSGHWVNGRLYGPSLYPLMAKTIACYAKCELPLIAGCGVFSVAAGQELLSAGAAAVQVDAVLWG